MLSHLNPLFFIKSSIAIQEIISASPQPLDFRSAPTVQHSLPTQNNVGFGTSTPLNEVDFNILGRFGVSKITAQKTVLENAVNIQNQTICGTHSAINTLACYNGYSGSLVGKFPIPGNLSTVPVFNGGSWIFGTSEGFLIRTQGLSLKTTPLLGFEQNSFWGPESRKIIKLLKPPSQLDGPEIEESVKKNFRSATKSGWQWFQTYSFEFVGTPVVLGNSIFILSSNGYAHSYQLDTGALNWSTKVSPETNLQMSNFSLAATQKELLCGSNDGSLVVLGTKDGTIIHRTTPSNYSEQTAQDKFAGVVAPPSLSARSAVFSTAESQTQKINLDTKNIEWTYALGSVSKTETFEGFTFIGGNEGSVAKVDYRTGALAWKVKPFENSIVHTISVVMSSKTNEKGILMSTKKGAIALINFSNGKTLATYDFSSLAVGDFFTIPKIGLSQNASPLVGSNSENRISKESSIKCLSFKNNSFKCIELAGF
jgi:PQQ-like domain